MDGPIGSDRIAMSLVVGNKLLKSQQEWRMAQDPIELAFARLPVDAIVISYGAPVWKERSIRRRPMSVPAKDSSRKPDSELLIAIATGNRRALEELYLGYQGRLARFLSRFTQRQENIEEIINDTFMVVWCNASDFRFASQVSSWLFGIAYRTWLKSIRRQKHYRDAQSLDECREETVDPMFESEIQDWVMHGLNRLPDAQRLTMELACHMGHSMLEIAEITGAPIGTVKARMFHARQKLRQCLPALSGTAALL
jgi:RNA polymerase sigma-70 factor (ECF subfamily)